MHADLQVLLEKNTHKHKKNRKKAINFRLILTKQLEMYYYS